MHTRAPLPNGFGQLPAIHSSPHDHVGKQEIESHALIDQREGRRPVGDGNGPISHAAKLGDHVTNHKRIVLDDQDRLVSRRKRICMRRRRLYRRGSLSAR